MGLNKGKKGGYFMTRKIPDVLTHDEQERLLNQFNLRYITPHRNKTMISFLLDTGLRLSEMTNLRWNDLDLMTGQLKVVQGKGAKDRILYMNDDLVKMLRSWKERQFEEWGASELVFTTRTLNKLDGKAVRKTIKTYADKAGIKKNISTHNLRHTFATDLLRNTKNIRTVQEALGHEDIGTTQIYTRIVNDELEDAMKNFRS